MIHSWLYSGSSKKDSIRAFRWCENLISRDYGRDFTDDSKFESRACKNLLKHLNLLSNINIEQRTCWESTWMFLALKMSSRNKYIPLGALVFRNTFGSPILMMDRPKLNRSRLKASTSRICQPAITQFSFKSLESWDTAAVNKRPFVSPLVYPCIKGTLKFC